MPFRFADGFVDAGEAFVHGAMCVLPGPDVGDLDRYDLPVAETLSGLFIGDALHAVLIAAVKHPEWAAAWYAALAESEQGDERCQTLAAELVDAAPITVHHEECA